MLKLSLKKIKKCSIGWYSFGPQNFLSLVGYTLFIIIIIIIFTTKILAKNSFSLFYLAIR